MNYLTLENVTKTYGEKTLFKNLNLQISKGQKIALVAKNGTGKSTMLRVIAGLEGSEGEQSKVMIHRDIRVGFLNQEPDFSGSETVMDAILQSDNPIIRAIRRYEEALLIPGRENDIQEAMVLMDDMKAWETEARMQEMLTKFKIERLDQQITTLSGGQQKRLALAQLIIDEPEFMILDEPTNHLDMDMIEWLEQYLAQPGITLFMVTHDRYFLERVCNNIVELENGNLYKYSGNYSQYLEKKALRKETESAELDKTRKLFERELDWVRRSPQARTTKAKSRVDGFEVLKDKVSGVRQNQEMSIDLKGQRLGKKILELHNCGVSLGNKDLVKGFSYKFKAKERVGIVGPNGVGKSTFLRLINGEIPTQTGKVVIGDNTVFGYYGQQGITLSEDKRVIDVIQDIAEFIPLEKGMKLTAAQLLERFLFPRPQQQVYASQLSGGERRRLYLLTVLMQNPNFLILDEPTNDLDVLTLNVLEDFLADFPGCIIIVSHDRFFLDKLVEHLFVFEGDGIISDFNGDYTEYRDLQKERDREQRRQERAEQQAQRDEATKQQQQEDKPKLSQEERKELKRLEKEIAQLEERKSTITDSFASPDITGETIEKLSKELNQVQKDLEEKELRWMELAELA